MRKLSVLGLAVAAAIPLFGFSQNAEAQVRVRGGISITYDSGGGYRSRGCDRPRYSRCAPRNPVVIIPAPGCSSRGGYYYDRGHSARRIAFERRQFGCR